MTRPPIAVFAACLCLAGVLALLAQRSATRPADIPFEKHTLDLGANESCAIADINGDGRPDIVSGENWYEAPRWIKHKFRSLPYTNNYIDNFSDLPLDVNGDGRVDIVSCSWFAHRLFWNENPGPGGGEWKEHMIETGSPVEFAFLVDLDNDGKAHEVLPEFGDTNMPLAWYEAKPEAKNGEFVKHIVSPKSWGHGIGVGDVNGDGRNDIITSMAHNYGIFWLEQGADGHWTKHIIDESWSQAHALTLVDLNGDGQLDLLTGKRYMAHNGHDPGEREPLGIYWYEFIRLDGGKKIEWVKHVVDYSTRTGGGMQIPVADLYGTGHLDFVVAGKSGLFLFENLVGQAPGLLRPLRPPARGAIPR